MYLCLKNHLKTSRETYVLQGSLRSLRSLRSLGSLHFARYVFILSHYFAKKHLKTSREIYVCNNVTYSGSTEKQEKLEKLENVETNSNVSGTSLASGAFDVHLGFFNTVANFSIRGMMPRVFRGATCLTAHSNCNASRGSLNPRTKHTCLHTPLLLVVYLAPPTISPLCCLKRRAGSGETPTYVAPVC